MDEEYIKMCREATEIQEQWKPKSGDMFHFKAVINPFKPCMFRSDVNNSIVSYSENNQLDKIWLPRQEDLQEIYMAPYKGGLHVSTMVNSFYRWFWDEYNNKVKSCLEQYDWNEIWLCFVMETCYSKRWTGETWEKTD